MQQSNMDMWNACLDESGNQLLWDLDWVQDVDVSILSSFENEHDSNSENSSLLLPSTPTLDKNIIPRHLMVDSQNTIRASASIESSISDPGWKIEINDSRFRVETQSTEYLRNGLPHCAPLPSILNSHPYGISSRRMDHVNKHIVSSERGSVPAKNSVTQSNNIGGYTPHERKLRIFRFLEKRKHRNWKRNIKYSGRKKLADTRPRFKGRFISADFQSSKTCTSSDESAVANVSRVWHDNIKKKMDPKIRDLYKRFLLIGRDYPLGLSYVREKAKHAFMMNRHLEDSTEIKKAIKKGRFVIRDLIGVIQMKKYRAVNSRYRSNDLTRHIEEIRIHVNHERTNAKDE